MFIRLYDDIILEMIQIIFLNKQFMPKFMKATRDIVTNQLAWHLLYLGFKKSRPSFGGNKITDLLIQPKQFIRGAYGYALNAPAFKIITKMQLYGGMEIDAFFEFVLCKYGKVLCFNPPIIEHRDNMISTITNAKWKIRDF